ncbi:glycosyltransferase family 2 protein [Agarivorans sp. TSD2052]|uniref:glycosyltransferase family 2 protein n=1 Tax=Agarivorans sp. TSD2052 TaxID=2937286 RepID=UPI00200EF50D|nr:glycosyltransferase family 2 protein [Agarivorans sp. TSD2052]UPW19344.1 glycosyltransferase family 2 protein [Agarivorans sp. TSD2052]
MFKPCVVIPNYNHTNAIESTVAQLNLPVILVDDCSSPSVADYLIELADKYQHVQLIQHAENQGKGGAVMSGLREANKQGYSHALQVDADGQHNLADVSRFLDSAKASPTALVAGVPSYDESIPTVRYYARYITHVWVWIETLSIELKDSMCGFRVYPLASTIALLDSSKLGKRMDFDIEILVKHYWLGTPIIQAPTKVIYPKEGLSHFRAWEDNWLISKMHSRLFFGMLWRFPKLLWRKRRQTHWSSMAERGSLWGLKVTLLAYRLGGRYLAKALLYPAIGYFYISGNSSRKASHTFLNKVARQPNSPLTAPISGLDGLRHFLSFGTASLNRLDAWTNKITRAAVDFPNKKLLTETLKSKQGAVLITSHLGHIEMCRALAETEYRTRINVVVLTANANKFNTVLAELNPDSQLNLIHISEFTADLGIRLAQFIEDGELVAIAADRTAADSYGRVNYHSFLGELAPFPQGPFLIAALLRCPVFSLFCMQQQDNRYHIYFEKLSDNLGVSRKERQSRIEHASQAYAKQLETLATRYPMQWFNFFDFWCPDKQDTVTKGQIR